MSIFRQVDEITSRKTIKKINFHFVIIHEITGFNNIYLEYVAIIQFSDGTQTMGRRRRERERRYRRERQAEKKQRLKRENNCRKRRGINSKGHKLNIKIVTMNVNNDYVTLNKCVFVVFRNDILDML